MRNKQGKVTIGLFIVLVIIAALFFPHRMINNDQYVNSCLVIIASEDGAYFEHSFSFGKEELDELGKVLKEFTMIRNPLQWTIPRNYNIRLSMYIGERDSNFKAADIYIWSGRITVHIDGSGYYSIINNDSMLNLLYNSTPCLERYGDAVINRVIYGKAVCWM